VLHGSTAPSDNGRVTAPDPWTLRRATGADAMAVAAVHVRSWQVAYRGIVPDAVLDNLDVAVRAARYTFDGPGPADPAAWIAVEGDAVLGFVVLGPCRDADRQGLGEVNSLYVDPDRWRSGLGAALMRRAEHELAARGFAAATLWVFEANARARRFYEASGWRLDHGAKVAAIGGLEIPEVRYRKALEAVR
jgi:GNAT superfamily N-acetyltransferase